MPKNSRRSIKNNPMDDLPADQQFEKFGTDVMTKIKEIREEFDELLRQEEKKIT